MSDATKLVIASVNPAVGAAIVGVGAAVVIGMVVAKATEDMLKEMEKRREEALRRKQIRFQEAKKETKNLINSLQLEKDKTIPLPFVSDKKISDLFNGLDLCDLEVENSTEEGEICTIQRRVRQIQYQLASYREESNAGSTAKDQLNEEILQQKEEMSLCPDFSEHPLCRELAFQIGQIEKIQSFGELEQAEESWTVLQSELESVLARESIRADLSQKMQIYDQEQKEKKILLDHLEKEWAELVQYKQFCSDHVALCQQWEQKKNNYLADSSRIQKEWISVLIKELRERNGKEKNRAQAEAPFIRLSRSISKQDSIQFDPKGYARIEKMLAILKDDVEKNDVRLFKRKMEEYRSTIDQHHSFVLSKVEDRNREIERVRLLLDDLQTDLDLLFDDSIVSRWMKKDLEERKDNLDSFRLLLAKGNFEEVEKQIIDYNRKIDTIFASAEELEKKENVRNYLIEGFEGILAEMGFHKLEDAYLSDPNDPRSTRILRTERVSGNQIALSVPQNREDPIQYSLEGFPLREEAESGQLVRSCDEAVQELEYLHEQLKELGIETSDLFWEGKPDHLYRQADLLPRDEIRQNNRKMEY